MAYNKAGEENIWHKWKVQEEKKLRELGVGEDIIDSLHQFDWEIFKSERRYQEHRVLETDFINQQEAKEQGQDVYDTAQLLELIDNEKLLHILISADKKTLQIILLKMMGYSISEISSQMGMKEMTIYKRIDRLKKKIKKIL